MICVSCGAKLSEEDRYCPICGAYQTEIRRFLERPAHVQNVPPASQRGAQKSVGAVKKLLRGIRDKRLSFHCETMQAIDRFAVKTPLLLTLDSDAHCLIISKGSLHITLPYEQILSFAVVRREKTEKNLLDMLQSMFGGSYRWVATLTYKALENGEVKHLQFIELEDEGYYDDETMSARAKRFEKAMDQIIQQYNPYGQLS